MDFPHGVTVYRLPYIAGTVDRYGNATDAWGSEQEVERCGFNPFGGSTEPFQAGRDAVVSLPELFAPFDSVWTPFDKVRIGDSVYTVEGKPLYADSFLTGWQPGVVMQLREVTG